MSALSFLFQTLFILFMNRSYRSHLQMALPTGHISHWCFLRLRNGLKGSYFLLLFPAIFISNILKVQTKICLNCLSLSSSTWALTVNLLFLFIYYDSQVIKWQLFCFTNYLLNVIIMVMFIDLKMVLRYLLFTRCTCIYVFRRLISF